MQSCHHFKYIIQIYIYIHTPEAHGHRNSFHRNLRKVLCWRQTEDKQVTDWYLRCIVYYVIMIYVQTHLCSYMY